MNEQIKEKNQINKIVIIPIVFLIIVGGYFVYSTFIMSTSNIYKNSIEQGFKELGNTIEELTENSFNYNLDTDTLTNKGTFAIKSNIEGFEELNDYTIDYKLAIDANNQIINAELGTTYNQEELVKILTTLTPTEILISLPGIYDRTLSSPIDIEQELFTTENLETMTVEEIKIVLDKLGKYIGDAMIDEQFQTENKTVKVDNEKHNVTAHIYELDSKTIEKMYTSITESIINDDELLDILTKYSDISKEELKKEILDSQENYDYNGEEITLEIYTKGILKKTFGMSTEIEGVTLEYFDINKTLTIYDNSTEVTLTFKENEIEITMYAEISTGENVFFDISLKNEVISENQIDTNISIRMTIEGEYVELNLDSTTTTNNVINSLDSSNKQNLETLTQEEINSMITNFETKVSGTLLELLLYI